MATAAFPDVIAALYSLARDALEPVRVVRGRDISDDPEDVVMIGVATLDEAQDESAGDFTQEMLTFGGPRQETGAINGLIVAWNGDGDQAAATATAFGYLATIEAALRADNTLGLSIESLVVQLQAGGEVAESQNSEGARTAVPFSVGYVAVI